MDEDLRNKLRWVLLTDEVSWRGELASALSGIASDLAQLVEVKRFLEQKLETADPHFQPRMQKMIEELGRRVEAHNQPDDGLSALFDEYLRLSGEIMRMEERLQPILRHRKDVERRIAEGMASGAVREAAGFRFEKIAEREGLEVVDPSLLPLELTVPSPDQAALDAWFSMHGTAPTGTRLCQLGGELVVEQLL